MNENLYKIEMTEQQRAFFLGGDWRECGKPFLQSLLREIERRASIQDDDEHEWYRLQGEARRLKLLLDIDEALRRNVKENKKEK